MHVFLQQLLMPAKGGGSVNPHIVLKIFAARLQARNSMQNFIQTLFLSAAR